MSEEITIEELFRELKDDLDFLPEDNTVREGFLMGLTFIMML